MRCLSKGLGVVSAQGPELWLRIHPLRAAPRSPYLSSCDTMCVKTQRGLQTDGRGRDAPTAGVSKEPGARRLQLFGVSVSERRWRLQKCVNNFSLWPSSFISFLLVLEAQRALCHPGTGTELAVEDRTDASALSSSPSRAN